jgi:hypothetical protein
MSDGPCPRCGGKTVHPRVAAGVDRDVRSCCERCGRWTERCACRSKPDLGSWVQGIKEKEAGT